MAGWSNQFRQSSVSELKSASPLWTIGISLLLVWLVGVMSSYTLGGALHFLLPLALAACIGSHIQRERADS